MKKLLYFVLCLCPFWGFSQELPDQEVEARGRPQTEVPTALRPDMNALLPAIPPLRIQAVRPIDTLAQTKIRMDFPTGVSQAPTVYPQNYLKAYAGIGTYLSRKVGGAIEYMLDPQLQPFASLAYDGTQGFGAYENQKIKAKQNQLDLDGGLRFTGKNLGGVFSVGTFSKNAVQYQSPLNSILQPTLQFAPNKQENNNTIGLQLNSAPCNPLQFLQKLAYSSYRSTYAFDTETQTAFSQKSGDNRYSWQPQLTLPFETFETFLKGNLSSGKVKLATQKDQLFHISSGIKLVSPSQFKVDIGFALARFNIQNTSHTVLHKRNFYMPILGIEGVIDRNLSAYFKHEPIVEMRNAFEISQQNPFVSMVEEVRPRISPIHFKGGVLLGTQPAEIRIEGSYEKADEMLIFSPLNSSANLVPTYTQAQIYALKTDARLRLSSLTDAHFHLTLQDGKQSNLNAPNRAIPFFASVLFDSQLNWQAPHQLFKLKAQLHAESSAPKSENPNQTLKPFVSFSSTIEIPVLKMYNAFLTFNQNRHRYEGLNNAKLNPAQIMVGLIWKE